MPRTVWYAALRGIAVLVGVVVLTFILLHLAPGDPARNLLGPDASPTQVLAARHALGLDQPLPAQLLRWLSRAAGGDFGVSIATGRPVIVMLRDAWPATAALVAASLLLTYLLAVFIGSAQANTRRQSVDTVWSVATVSLAAMPAYWLALVLVMLFTYRLGILPAFGARGVDAEFLPPLAQLADLLRHATLPLLTLTLIGAGGIARFVRAGMRELRGVPFLAVAEAKGIPHRRAVIRHQLRNALVPLVTLLGLSLPAFFSGTVFVESVFAWPGVGQLLVQGVQARDYPVVMAGVTVSAVLVVAGNLLADVLLLWVDPRVRTT